MLNTHAYYMTRFPTCLLGEHAKESRGRPQSPLVASAEAKPLLEKFHFELYRTYVERIGTSIFIDGIAIHCHGDFIGKKAFTRNHTFLACI